jgi:hypothetical protein
MTDHHPPLPTTTLAEPLGLALWLEPMAAPADALPVLNLLSHVQRLIEDEMALHQRTVEVLNAKKHAVITEQLFELAQLDETLRQLRTQVHKQARQRLYFLQANGIASGHLSEALAYWQHATGATTPEQFRQCANALAKVELQRSSLRELMHLGLRLTDDIEALLALSLQWARQTISLMEGDDQHDSAQQASAYSATGPRRSKPFASLPPRR